MNPLFVGIAWALVFVVMEAIQFVYFGGIFQNISSFVFGFAVFGIIALLFIGGCAIKAPDQLRIAFANPSKLIGVNVFATLAWVAYLTSVQLLEPAVVYTISAGVMPLTAYLAHRFGVPEGEGIRDKAELFGLMLILSGVVYLAVITLSGHSGFVRGGRHVAIFGILLAMADGVLFTWMLIFCQRLDRVGVGPRAVFGLRFPLYVIVAGAASYYGVDAKPALPPGEIVIMVILGLLLTVPHLYALQEAVAKISTPLISALTALGPFVIFLLQMIEGRVDYSNATLIGLFIYFAGALFCVFGALKNAG